MNPGPHNTSSLLRRIREIMAESDEAQQRLDSLVTAIADELQCEVCSIYLRREGDAMELFATRGLNQSAVHQTSLQPGEGLVGEVVRSLKPLNVVDASQHKGFSFHPETDEEVHLSFLGVPVLRASKLLGVLVVQDHPPRVFSKAETEAVQNISMVLAEIVASGELLNSRELQKLPIRAQSAQSLAGVSLVKGLAMGEAVLLEPHIVSGSRVAVDPEAEIERLQSAILQLRASLDQLFMGKGHALGEPTREVMHAYRMFARDESWFERLVAAANAGLTAEAAVERVQQENRQRMLRARDPYIRERLHDLDDLANRLLRHLGGVGLLEDLPRDAVLVARNIGPAELLEFDHSRVKALVLEEGSRTSHASIVASALRLPVLGRVNGLLAAISEGDQVLVDAEEGEIVLRPAPETGQSFIERIQVRQQDRAVYAKLKDQPAISKDGIKIDLLLNAGLEIDLPRMNDTGADGIGLFRTEFQFMLADALPKQAQLSDLYQKVMQAAGDKPVVFRTLDLGGDKILPYVAHEREANPALGWRAIRMAVDRPGMFRYQLRALLHAAAKRTLRIMFPMVSTVEEFTVARQMLIAEQERLDRFGHKDLPEKILIGCMIETPALVWQLPELLESADFLSIGANDLMQCFFAADRENIRVADRYDPLHPASLKMLNRIASASAKASKPLSVCGDMASRRTDALALLAIGIRQLSVPASSIGPLKQMILRTNIAELAGKMEKWQQQPGVNMRQKFHESQ